MTRVFSLIWQPLCSCYRRAVVPKRLALTISPEGLLHGSSVRAKCGMRKDDVRVLVASEAVALDSNALLHAHLEERLHPMPCVIDRHACPGKTIPWSQRVEYNHPEPLLAATLAESLQWMQCGGWGG